MSWNQLNLKSICLRYRLTIYLNNVLVEMSKPIQKIMIHKIDLLIHRRLDRFTKCNSSRRRRIRSNSSYEREREREEDALITFNLMVNYKYLFAKNKNKKQKHNFSVNYPTSFTLRWPLLRGRDHEAVKRLAFIHACC